MTRKITGQSPRTCDIGLLMEMFSLSRRQIERLAEDGTVVRVARGRYDMVASVHGYLAYVVSGQSTEHEPDALVKARTDLLEAQARRERRNNEIAEGQLCWTSHVQDIMAGAVTQLAAQLDGVAGRLANDVAGETNPAVCRQLIFDEHRRIRAAYGIELERLFDPPKDKS